MQAYWLVVRVLLTPPAAAAASQKWKIIYLQVLRTLPYQSQKWSEPGSKLLYNRKGSYRSLTVAALFCGSRGSVLSKRIYFL